MPVHLRGSGSGATSHNTPVMLPDPNYTFRATFILEFSQRDLSTNGMKTHMFPESAVPAGWCPAQPISFVMFCHQFISSHTILLKILFYFGIQLINNVTASDGQQRDSAIHIHVPILPQTPLPSRLPHHSEQSSLCYTIGPCWLSTLNIAVCTSPSQIP